MVANYSGSIRNRSGAQIGCVTSTLVKVGDGAWNIIAYSFATTEYFTTADFKAIYAKVMGLQEVYDIDLFDMPAFSPILIFAPLLCYIASSCFVITERTGPKYKLPQSYTGMRHVFCEKI